MLKLLFSLLLAFIFSITAFSQTTEMSCSPQNMKYWTLLVLGNQSKEIVKYDLKVNDDSPTGYLGYTQNMNFTSQTKHANGSMLPWNGEQDNSVYVTKVVLPHCRGPASMITGVSCMAVITFFLTFR